MSFKTGSFLVDDFFFTDADFLATSTFGPSRGRLLVDAVNAYKEPPNLRGPRECFISRIIGAPPFVVTMKSPRDSRESSVQERYEF